MAYMNQEHKAKLAPAIKSVLKKYGMKGSIGVSNHSTLVVNVKSGKLDVLQNWFDDATKNGPLNMYGDVIQKPTHIQVNEYWISEQYTGTVKDFLLELKEAMNVGNWDKSDIQTDYFNVGWYLSINIGKWDKPYQLEA